PVVHRVDDQCGGVDRGDEEDDDEDDRYDRHRSGQWIVVEEREERSGDVAFTDDAVDQASAPVELDVEGGVSEDAEPQDRERRGDREDADDELADGPAAGDAGDEDADEGRPGDRPGPVEDRPGVLPAG